LSKPEHEIELRAEREYIAFLYRQLEVERAAAADSFAAALQDSSDRDPAARWQRDVSVLSIAARQRGLSIADNSLCFGRIDQRDGGHHYLGRIGLFDRANGYEPLLMDWRAPAARPFYCATAANPEGLVRRRHFHTRGRQVDDFLDEYLDLESAGDQPEGDTALLAALNAPREATMRDIVATVQAEQDEIIRLDDTGVVVIEGGPGTGKTAVALHRVAYLLYTRRDALARSGVLVIGPNPGFLHYIGDVLPSLGETGVVFATPGELVPGVRPVAEDRPDARRVKGGIAMAEVLAAALADRQRVPAEPIDIELDDLTVPLDRELVEPARKHARASRLLHNEARAGFRAEVLAAMTERAVRLMAQRWEELFDLPASAAGDLAGDLGTELAESAQLDAELEELWPLLTPEQLVSELFSLPERLAVAAAALPAADRAALGREDGEAWTLADIPLLDEAAELLGQDDAEQRQAADRAERERIAYAEGVLAILDTEEDPDEETLRAVDLLGSGDLADRQTELDTRDLAERAAADRQWTYGHVVVDEAHELSEMDWRVLMRRCPSRSLTVVGDLAQRESPAGARSWGAMLDRYVPERWAYRQLTVNYRMPTEIMAVAADVLAEVDPALRPPTSVRSNGIQPWARRVAPAELGGAVTETVRAFAGEVGTGSVAVIAPDGTELAGYDGAVLTPRAAKGLEFDAVILLEPHRILEAADLYVALTRSTQRLGVVHTADLPPALHRLHI
jgi:DNA helicase IV